MFEPRVALASLSGAADAAWAANGAPFVGTAFLGGIAIDAQTRAAARRLVARDREEFLPSDPAAFVNREFEALTDVDLRPAINVRAASHRPIPAIARVCRRHDAILELNAHCRQQEMCEVGAGEALLADTERLVEYVGAAEAAPAISVKVRAEVPGVDLPAVAERVAAAGADAFHVDAMDSEPVIEDVTRATELFVIANNEVRDRASVAEYVGYGADAVSVGRPSDNPAVLNRVRTAIDQYLDGPTPPAGQSPDDALTALEGISDDTAGPNDK